MILNLIALILVLLITMMQTIFGLFSGIINLVCTIVAALVAFGFFEPASAMLIQNGIHPAYAEPCVLLGLFVLTLLGLRTAADNLIRGNVTLPPALDWGGAGVLGFINGQICVGMLIISVLLLPIGGRVMTFSRYERAPDEQNPDRADLALFERRALWLRSDDFTIALVNMLSGGSMSSGTAFASVYPSFTDWVFYSGNTVQWESTPAPYRDKKGDGAKNGLEVKSWWEQTDPVIARYRKDPPTVEKPYPPYSTDKTVAPLAGMKFVGVRIELKPAAADRDGSIQLHLFRPTMIRLVGDAADSPMHFTPIMLAGVDQKIEGKPRLVDPDNNFRLAVDENIVDAYFETPEDFTPRFVEYRRHARAATTNAEPVKLARKPAPLPPLLTPEEKARIQASGAFRFVDAVEPGRTGDVDDIPVKLSPAAVRRGANGEVEGKTMKSGRVQGVVTSLAPQAGEEPVEKFKLPEGHRIFQLQYYPKRALTLAGQVFNYVALNVNQYKCSCESGNTYMLSGYYAIVKRGGNDYIELFYSGAPPGEPTGYNHMLNFSNITSAELQADDTVLGLLFVVKAGEVVTGVSNQQDQGVSGFRYPTLQSGG